VAGVGRPARGRRGIPHHQKLFALRQREQATVSRDAGPRRAYRSPRHLLGAGKVGRAAPRPTHESCAADPAHQHGRGSYGRAGTLRSAEGGCAVLCLRHQGDGRTCVRTGRFSCRVRGARADRQSM